METNLSTYTDDHNGPDRDATLLAKALDYFDGAAQSVERMRREAAVQRVAAIGEPAVEPMIERWLANGDARKKELAERALIALGDTAVDGLSATWRTANQETRGEIGILYGKIGSPRAMAELERELVALVTGMRRRRLRLRLYGIALISFGIGFTTVCGWLHIRRYTSSLELLVRHLSSILGWGLLGRDLITVHHKTQIELLSKWDDTRAVSVLAPLIWHKDLRGLVAVSLTRILPRVQASDREHITPAAMEALIKALGHEDYHLVTAIVRAMEQIGDERALPAIERLALKPARGRIRDAARAALPALRQRAEEARLANTLLRPAGLSGEEQLLRPAGSAVSEAENLLHTANREE